MLVTREGDERVGLEVMALGRTDPEGDDGDESAMPGVSLFSAQPRYEDEHM